MKGSLLAPYLSQVYRIVLGLIVSLPLAATAQYTSETIVRSPELLVGTWEGPFGDARYREQWLPAGPSTYDGVAHVLENGRVIGEERMRLTRFADQWVFLASTGGSVVTSFVRVEAGDDMWVFENREHDFPQRIGYCVRADTLRAFIDHLYDPGRRVDFVLTRSE
jgi:hypothetical protein